MQKIEINAMQEKVKIIESLRAITVFFNNNRAQINPMKFAEAFGKIENIEAKAKQSFAADDGFDPLLEKFTASVEEQEKLILAQQNRLEKNGEDISDDDAYKGVVIKDV